MISPIPPDSGVSALIRQASEDLAKRLGTTRENIEIVQFEVVVWPDGSLGCQQPGLEYPQVQMEGYRIQLRFADHLYYYHGGGDSPPFLCELDATSVDNLIPSNSKSP